MAIAVESPFVFVVTFGETSSGLSYVDLTAIWAGEFVDSLGQEFVRGWVHSFGPIKNIMQVLHHQKKGAHLNTTEIFYIHVEHATSNNLNDNHTIFPNKIFDTLIKTK